MRAAARDVNTEPIPAGSGMDSALGVYVIAGSRGFPRNTIQYVPFIIPAVPQEKMSTHFCRGELKQMFNVINNCQASAPTEMFNSQPPREQTGAAAPTWETLAAQGGTGEKPQQFPLGNPSRAIPVPRTLQRAASTSNTRVLSKIPFPQLKKSVTKPGSIHG